MMTFSDVSFSCAYEGVALFIFAAILLGKMASSLSGLELPLASFCCQARGIMFYDTPLSMVLPGTSLCVQLEPSNPHDANCISLWLSSHSLKLGHLAREAAVYLAPLLRNGLIAYG